MNVKRSRPAADDDAEALTGAFVSAFRGHPAGVAIITADPGGGPVALTVSSLISVSASPPTVAFSLSDASSSARTLGKAETMVVHFVRRSNMDLARLCATSGKARFGSDVVWDRLPTGEPYYPEVAMRFRAVVRGRLSAAGASVVTAELLEASKGASAPSDGDALVYADRAWHSLGPRADASRAPLLLWPDDSATF